MAIRILRLPACKDKSGDSRSTTYQKIKDGIWPPPVAIGPRSRGWVEHEIEAVLAARVAGKTENEIRALVAGLIEARSRSNAA
jgi:prophage regulatory protein